MAGQIAERVSETFSFAKKIPMLKKATSDDDNPTPGYIYQEINSITYESISGCNSLLDYLVGRLKKQSPYIKYKVLKVLCYLASNGHSEFRSGLRHNADALREAESFTGQMDYLKGDAPNQRVRSAASELIELLFNVESCGTSTIHAMTGPSGKKMEGFGNSPSQPAKNKTWLDSMKNFAERLPDAANLLKHKNEQENMPTTGLGGSSMVFLNYTDLSSADSGSKKFLDDDDSFQESENEDSTESENGLSVEMHLVDKITSEGGIRAVPSKEDLIHFTKRCSALNIDKMLAALNNRLLEPVTEVQLKSLHVLDHLLKSDIPDVGTRMSHCCTNLQEITKTESGSVLSKATKILSMIKAKMEKEKIKQVAQKTVEDSEMPRVTHSQDLLKLENVNATGSLSSQQFPMDDTPALFSGMSLHSQTENTSRSKQFGSPATVLKNQHSSHVDVLQGLEPSSGNRLPENDNFSRQSLQSSKSELDDLFCVTQEAKRPGPVTPSQEPMKSSVTDLFDPLCTTISNPAGKRVTQLGVTLTTGLGEQRCSTKANSLISFPGNSSNVIAANPGFSGLTGSIHSPVNPASGSNTFEDLNGLSRNETMQPNVTLPGNAFLMTNPYPSKFPNTSHPRVHPSVLSGGSTIPLRLPPPSQKTDFAFVGKSGKADAFSFVQDEMKAKK